MTYDYKVVEIIRVIDGDTAIVRIDLGFYTTCVQRIRFLGCDAPERHETGHDEVWSYTTNWLTYSLAHGNLRVATTKADSFGRWLGDFYTGDEHIAPKIVALMAEHGWSSPAVR